MTIFEQLSAPFPQDVVSWRCQTLSQNGDGLALAYIDARDVMRRLDEVVGPEFWQDRYEVHGNKTLCYLSIKTGEWVTKADGAGDTDVEAEKGSISDAFKRSAVKWGIGRYLYDLDAPWVPCETYDKGGKKYWKKWKVSPWTKVTFAPHPVSTPAPTEDQVIDFGIIKRKLEAEGSNVDEILKAESETIVSLPDGLKERLRNVVRFVREARKVAA